jgi:hypothetical protein
MPVRLWTGEPDGIFTGTFFGKSLDKTHSAVLAYIKLWKLSEIPFDKY